MLKDKTIDDIAKLSFQNSERNEKPKVLACYYCLDVFTASDVIVEERIHDGPDTDLCPHCGIDSVISIDIILEEINQRMF